MTGTRILFAATHHGQPVTVCHADEVELAAFAGTFATAEARDELEAWSPIAIRNLARDVAAVHALGWRPGIMNTWITSALRTVDTAAGTVSTSSGHTYTLGRRDDPDLDPELRGHLAYALRRWGFDDVRAGPFSATGEIDRAAGGDPGTGGLS